MEGVFFDPGDVVLFGQRARDGGFPGAARPGYYYEV